MHDQLSSLEDKFRALEAENAPGQELRKDNANIKKLQRGPILEGIPVDFSHGDVNAFPPTPQSNSVWNEGFEKGTEQAYTEYRGALNIRKELATHLAKFTGREINADKELIITPGTQGALFLALGSTVGSETKVAIAEPDYFANRKLVRFFGGEIHPISLNYNKKPSENGIDLKQLKKAFINGANVFVFSTPNNPTGLVYSNNTILEILKLADIYKVTLIVDQLYSRMLYSGEEYTHMRSLASPSTDLITIMGPSKTESLSGYRLGVAFGCQHLIERMERLQAIVSLRAAGYNQAVLNTWFREPQNWLKRRIEAHEAIRDDILKIFRDANLRTATPQAGSYLFPELPPLSIDLKAFVALLRYQAKVTVTPGTEFAPSCINNIRLNFSQDHVAAVSAAERIVEMIKLYKK